MEGEGDWRDFSSFAASHKQLKESQDLEISMGNSEQHQREKAKPQISMGLFQDKQLPECVEHLYTQSEERKTGKATRWNKSFESRCSSHTGGCGLFQGNEHLQSPSSPAGTSLDRCC